MTLGATVKGFGHEGSTLFGSLGGEGNTAAGQKGSHALGCANPAMFFGGGKPQSGTTRKLCRGLKILHAL